MARPRMDLGACDGDLEFALSSGRLPIGNRHRPHALRPRTTPGRLLRVLMRVGSAGTGASASTGRTYVVVGGSILGIIFIPQTGHSRFAGRRGSWPGARGLVAGTKD